MDTAARLRFANRAVHSTIRQVLAATHAAECAKSFEQLRASVTARGEELERDADYDSHRGIAPPSTPAVSS
jgi:hypothetical protein